MFYKHGHVYVCWLLLCLSPLYSYLKNIFLKLRNAFVQIVKCICSNCKNIFVEIPKYICSNSKIYLSQIEKFAKKFSKEDLSAGCTLAPSHLSPPSWAQFSQHSSPWTATAKIDPHTKWSKAKYLQHS